MVWFASALFALTAAVLVVARRPLAEGQAYVFGGRMGPGCVIAEAVAFVVLAVLVVVFRDWF